MTWGAFLVAMRNGVAQRGSQQAGRRTPQTVNQTIGSSRTVSSQTKQAAEEASDTPKSKKFLPDEWDFMVLDVCFSAKM